MEIILDADKMQDKEGAQKYLKEMLDFPEYYGGNLDALYDCLTDCGEKLNIIILNHMNMNAYGMKILKILQHADVEVELR